MICKIAFKITKCLYAYVLTYFSSLFIIKFTFTPNRTASHVGQCLGIVIFQSVLLHSNDSSNVISKVGKYVHKKLNDHR